MKKIRNPFIDDSIVSGEDYCQRLSIEEKISKKLKSGHNLALIGDRRIGKTSTAHYVVDNRPGLHKIDVDFYHVKEVTDVASSLIHACRKSLEQIWDIQKVLHFIKSLRPKINLAESELSLGFEVQDFDDKETLDSSFQILEEVIKRLQKKVVVLFDEFQAIRELKESDFILKFMRGRAQRMTRIPLIYIGSVRHEMDHIFRNPDSPFFKQAEIVYFDHVGLSVFFDFISERFKRKKIVLKKIVYIYLYHLCHGITGDIQTFCRVAFDVLESETVLDFKSFFFVLETIYKNEQRYFTDTLDKRLTKLQRNVLIQLSGIENSKKVKNKVLKKLIEFQVHSFGSELGLLSWTSKNARKIFFREDFRKLTGVKSPGAMSNTLEALFKKGHIYQSENQYLFTNPFFREWIRDYRLTVPARAGVLRAGGMRLRDTRLGYLYREDMMRLYDQ